MPTPHSLVLLFALTAFIALVAFILYKAFTSPLRPFYIVGMAWKSAAFSLVTNPIAVACVVLVIGCGRLLQRLLNAYPVFSDAVMLPLSIGWQATMQISLAAIAVSLHLHTIELVKSRYQLDDFYLETPYAAKLLPAALYGAVIWLIGYGTLAGARLLLSMVDSDYPTLIANSLSLILFLFASMMMLVRPAYSLEIRAPVLTGITIALRAAAPLLVIQFCLSMPVVLYNIANASIMAEISATSPVAKAIGDLIFVLFSALQFCAVEIAAIMLVARQELRRYVYKKSYG